MSILDEDNNLPTNPAKDAAQKLIRIVKNVYILGIA